MDRFYDKDEEVGRIDPHTHFARSRRARPTTDTQRRRWCQSQIVLGTDTDSIQLAAADRRYEQAPGHVDSAHARRGRLSAPSPQRPPRGPGLDYANRIAAEGFPEKRPAEGTLRTHKRLGDPARYQSSINLFAYQTPPTYDIALPRELRQGHVYSGHRMTRQASDERSDVESPSWVPAPSLSSPPGEVVDRNVGSSKDASRAHIPWSHEERVEPPIAHTARTVEKKGDARWTAWRSSQKVGNLHTMADGYHEAAVVCQRLRRWCDDTPTVNRPKRDPWLGL